MAEFAYNAHDAHGQGIVVPNKYRCPEKLHVSKRLRVAIVLFLSGKLEVGSEMPCMCTRFECGKANHVGRAALLPRMTVMMTMVMKATTIADCSSCRQQRRMSTIMITTTTTTTEMRSHIQMRMSMLGMILVMKRPHIQTKNTIMRTILGMTMVRRVEQLC